MQLLTARHIKAWTRVVRECDLQARTNVHLRRFTINFENRKLEKERKRKRERGGGKGRRQKACETIYDVECVRIDGVRLMAILMHDIIIDRGLSYCGKNVENRKWRVRNYKWWQKRKSFIRIYFFLFESIYIYIIYRRDFYTFFLSMNSSRENVMSVIVKYFRLSAIGELTKVFFCLTIKMTCLK